MNSIGKACQVFYHTIFVDARDKDSSHITGSKLGKKRTIRSGSLMARDESQFYSVIFCVCSDHLHNLRKKTFRQKDTCLLLRCRH